jgi:hypothetical protein
MKSTELSTLATKMSSMNLRKLYEQVAIVQV